MPHTAISQERKLRQFEVLARVSSVINSTLEPKEVLNRVLAEAVRVMQATSGSLVFIDPHTQMLQIEVAIGLSEKAQQTKLAIGRGVTGWVAKMGKPLRVPDVTADPRYVSVRKDIRSELAVPLLVEGALIGVLNVDSKEHDAFSAEDEELLVAIAESIRPGHPEFVAVPGRRPQRPSTRITFLRRPVDHLLAEPAGDPPARHPRCVPLDGLEGLLAHAAQSDA